LLQGQNRDGLKRLRDGEPVLIVAEPAEIRTVLRGMLRAVGCSEIADIGGAQAMALLGERKFALVIADLATPEMNGYDLLRRIRADASLATLPFVLVTPPPTEQMVIAAKRLGVDGCLVKPFNLAMLARQASLALRQGSGDADSGLPAGGGAELRAGVAVLMRMIERRLAAAELTLDDDTLLLLKSYLGRASELGLGRRYALAFESLCSALRATLETEFGAPPIALRDPADGRGAVPLPAPRWELRRFRRFTAPTLHVAMLGQPYRTLDWSAGGLALARFSGTLATGRAVEATIRMEGGEPDAALFREPLVIVRNNPATGRLSARFQPRSWTSLKLMEQLIHRRIGAREGGIAA
jgi:two-component system chemotaxis response regulator CheY